MTLIAENTAEGGTNGSAVAAGGTGSGNAWDSVVNTSGVITYDNTHVDFGSLAIKVAMLSAVCRVTWSSSTLGSRTELYYAGDFYFTGSPSSSCHFVEGVTAAAAQAWAIDIASTGKLFVRNAANTNIYTSTNSIPVNTWCRVEAHYIAGATAGTLQVRLYSSPAATSALEDSGALSTNTGTDTSSLYVGALTGSTALPAYWAGDQRVGDAAGGWLGPLGAGVSGPAALSGSGSLSAAASPAVPVAAVLAGAGTLSASGVASQPGTVALSGAGSLATAAAPALPGAAALSGTGTLTAAARSAIVQQLLAGAQQFVAHRNGVWATYGECTLAGYRTSAAQYSKALLEIPVWASSDGIYYCLHDRTTGSRNQYAGPSGNVDVTVTNSAVLDQYTSVVGGYPLARLTDVIDALPGRLFVVENKQGTNQATLCAQLDQHAAGRWMFKGPYNDTANANIAAAHGAPMWLYFYPAQLSSLPTTYSAVAGGGVPIVFGIGDYSAAPIPVQSDANTFYSFTAANGVLTWAHILGTTAQKSTADSQATAAGATLNGYMVSSFPTLAPTDAAAATLTGSGVLSAGGQPAVPAGAALSGAGSLAATAASPSSAAVASLSGAGTLSAASQPAIPIGAALAGDGSLAAATQSGNVASADLAGSGALSAAAIASAASAASFAGLGQLVAASSASGAGGTALTGAGELVAVGDSEPPPDVVVGRVSVALGARRYSGGLGDRQYIAHLEEQP